MADIQDYLDLIASQHQDKPKYIAMVTQCLAPFVQVQNLQAAMIALFDLDTPPVGNQLDIIGQWVGISRNLKVPISGDGIYFAWDSTAAVGWDSGSWQPSDLPTTITVLPDAAYLTLIRAKIAANGWDGTTEGAYQIYDIVFPNIKFLIIDHQDMSYDLGVQGQVLDALTIALITGGYLGLRPEGVMVTNYIIPDNAGPFFGWDIDTDFISGWDIGSWGSIISG